MKYFIAVVLGSLSLALAAQTPLPDAGGAVHLGAKSCADGACHGAAQGSPFAAVTQDEYRVWRQQDRHAQAFSTLAGPQAARITRALGLGPAQQQAECLACHADNVPATRRGKNFSLADGVGCEACHGGAEKWIGAHSQNRPHAQNLRDGMFPTDQPRERARLCLGCHAGSEERPFTHRLLGAGHPRLLLELDAFTLARPAHHVEDADYRTRKPGASAIRTWAIGQSQAALHWLAQTRRKLAGDAALFPEFSAFECYGCHRGMQQGQAGGGRPRLDSSALRMLMLLSQRLTPALAADLKKQIERLEAAADRAAATVPLADLESLAQQAAQACDSHVFVATDARAWLDLFFAGAAAGELDRHAVAEQATYALGALTAALQETGGAAKGRAVDAALTALYDAVEEGGGFDSARFQSAVRGLAKALSGAERK